MSTEVSQQTMNQTSVETVSDSDKIFSGRSVKNYVAQACASMGTQSSFVSSYFSFFFTEFMGIGAAAIAIILSISTILDGVSDFVAGAVLDRFHTKRGKAVHWLRWMFLPVTVSMFLIFMCPQNASVGLKLVYIFIIYNVYNVALTFCRMPSTSIMVLVSDNQKVRSILWWVQNFFLTVGGTLTGVLLTVFASWFGGLDSMLGYRGTLAMFSIMAGVFIGLAGFLYEEKRSGADWDAIENQHEKESGKKKTPFKDQVVLLFKNKYWVIYQLVNFFGTFGPGFSMGVMAYFCKYSLGDESTMATLMTIGSMPMLLGSIAIIPFLKKFDARALIIFGYIGCIAASIVMWIYGVQLFSVLVATYMIKTFFSGFYMSIQGSLMGRVVDYGEWKFGERQDGMAFGGQSVVSKITAALASLTLGFILAGSGYVGGGDQIATSAVNAITFLFLGAPVISSVISLALLFFFDLSQGKVDQMRKEITERNAAKGIV